VNNLNSVGAASITGGTATVSNSAIGPGSNQDTVNLIGVRNDQYIKVTLTGVNDGTNISTIQTTMGLLLGDVDSSGRVDAADVSLVRQQTLQPVTSSNFREDIHASGRIDAADASTGRQQTLTSLPLAP
jgi:hypothetical protein